MTFTITSIGDAAFLERVLLALAFLSTDGTIAGLAKIGLIAALPVVAFRGIFVGQGPAFHHVGIGLILYLGFFTVPATVIVEDVYTGQARVVSNVPLGVASSGAMISSLGYGLTSKFEQAFSTPEMTQQGWGNSLHVIQTTRRMMLTEEDLGSANTAGGPGTSFWQSWVNYINDCTLAGYLIDEKEWAHYVAEPNFADALRWDSQAYFTKINILSSGASTVSCADAWSPLMDFTKSKFLPAFYSTVLGQRLRQSGVPNSDQVQQALSDIGLTVTADDFVLTALLSRIFDHAMIMYHVNNREWSYATAIQDALNQRADSWLADSSLFDKFMRPMLTIIEGFAYATAPLAVLLLGMGPAGMTVLGNFLMALVWIQMWMPLLAVVQLFTHMALAGKMSALEGTGGLTGASLAGLMKADTLVQEWVGVAGMLASSVPVLSYALVRGGSVATTAMLGKMTGGDFFNEKRTSPDLVSAPPTVQEGSRYNSDPARGLHRTDAAATFGVSSEMALQYATSYQKLQKSSEAFTESLGRAGARFSTAAKVAGTGGSFAEGDLSIEGRTVSAGVGNSGRSEKGKELDATREHSRGLVEAASIGGSVGFSIPSASIGGVDTASRTAKEAGAERSHLSGGTVVEGGGNKKDAISANVEKAKSLMSRYGKDVGTGKLSKEEETAVKSAAELVEANTSFTETAQKVQRAAASMNFDGRRMVQLARSDAGQKAIQRAMSDPAFAAAVRSTTNMPSIQNDYPDPGARMLASGLMVALNASPYQKDISEETRQGFLTQALASNAHLPEGVNERVRAVQAMPTPEGGVKERVEEQLPTSGIIKDTKDLPREAEAQYNSTQLRVADQKPSEAAEPRQDQLFETGKELADTAATHGREQIDSLAHPIREEVDKAREAAANVLLREIDQFGGITPDTKRDEEPKRDASLPPPTP